MKELAGIMQSTSRQLDIVCGGHVWLMSNQLRGSAKTIRLLQVYSEEWFLSEECS